MDIKEQVKYLITLILIFLLLGYLKHHYFYVISFIFSISLLSSKSRFIAISAWQKLGLLLQKIISPIVLSLLYFFVLTPIAVLKKIFSKTDPLISHKPQLSNFQKSEIKNNIDDFEKLW